MAQPKCSMLQIVDAIYEKGMFRPLTEIYLSERQKVKIVFMPEGMAPPADDLPALALAVLAEQSPSFAFLADPREDIYSLEDGEPVS